MTREELEAQGYSFDKNSRIFTVHRTVKNAGFSSGAILIFAQSCGMRTLQQIEKISCEAAMLHFVKACLDGEEHDLGRT